MEIAQHNMENQRSAFSYFLPNSGDRKLQYSGDNICILSGSTVQYMNLYNMTKVLSLEAFYSENSAGPNKSSVYDWNY